ncbi:uncharacterized protein LOC114973209 [Acropora millepora]|uniref:uncharacterized protein LOC114973209 n=1 Tax=Acropora millepora TaxID=45264 RepID=UPI001CF37F60|nr:uncharacterized protein LOC114973209 [Acropora millepora]
MESGQCFEILKIWVPRHGVVNVYRSPGGDYHVDNGCLLEKTRNECGIEKIRILDSHGSVIVITRDGGHILVQNKYSIEPTTLVMDVSFSNMHEIPSGCYFKMLLDTTTVMLV